MARFTEENVAKNMDNIRDRWNEVNGKSLHVDKQTFIEKIIPYCNACTDGVSKSECDVDSLNCQIVY